MQAFYIGLIVAGVPLTIFGSKSLFGFTLAALRSYVGYKLA